LFELIVVNSRAKKPINNDGAEKLLLELQEMGQGQALAAWLSGVPAIS
jgi:hypothetical protein